MNLKKEKFFLTGRVPTRQIFFYTHTRGAVDSVKSDMIILSNSGVLEWHAKITKKVLWYKNFFINVPNNDLKNRYKKWKNKWQKYDKKFYKLATQKKTNCLKDWKWLDTIDKNFWFDSYPIELLDPFADEIEAMILGALKKAKINKRFLYELISPAEPTLTQKIALEKNKIKTVADESKFLRKYWFSNGTWNGGTILNQNLLKENKKEKLVKTDFETRKKLHKNLYPKLNNKTRNLIENLCLLTLWREERKAFMQKINLSYIKILDNLEKKTGLTKEKIAWARPEEFGLLKKNPDIFDKRKIRSVYYYKFGETKPRIIFGKKAEQIFSEFTTRSAVRELKGTIASKGIATNKVRIILTEHHFYRFKDKEILVTSMTRPEFIPIVRRASAVITDEGGLTSHAAIISREFKKPCIIGTKIATKVLKDGQLVEVNANLGIVKILEK